jgi:glycerophosphoryl diester phosphodiesterase
MALVPTALLRLRARPRHVQALCIPQRWRGLPVPVAALVRALRASRTVVHVWTVNDPAEAKQLWQHGVQGIISDDPARMLAARAAAGSASVAPASPEGTPP